MACIVVDVVTRIICVRCIYTPPAGAVVARVALEAEHVLWLGACLSAVKLLHVLKAKSGLGIVPLPPFRCGWKSRAPRGGGGGCEIVGDARNGIKQG
jgi:hypothetical protein